MITYRRLRELVIGKLVDRTITDSFESMSEEIFGEGNNFSESEVRKRMYGMRTMIEAIDNDGGLPCSASESDDLAARTLEFKKERRRFLDQRREYEKLVTADARFDHIEERLVTAALNLASERPLVVPDTMYDLTANEAVLVLTDWHYGMVTDNMWNEFNTEICRQRVGQLVASVKDRLRIHRPHKLHVVILGDLMQGGIHATARVASEELVCDQLMHVSELVAEAICELSGHAGETWVYATYGNHARTIQNKNDNIHYDNMERIIPWWLQLRLGGAGIHVVTSDYPEFVTFAVCNKIICGVHGDLDYSRNTGKTLYTLFSQRTGEHIDYVIMGDKHHLEEFEELGVEVTVVRSLCGTDEYANTKRLYSAPGQTLMIFHPSCGKDAVYNIRLD